MSDSDIVTIEVTGIDELLALYQKSETVATQMLVDAMGNALDYVAQDAAIYPAESEANNPPPPYYIRGTGTQYANGGNRQESQQLNTHWQESLFCEWHLGDQHRKASAKPSTFEEQGVSVEYLPSLTPANEWHRLKGFNWQKRGGTAFVYDFASGPLARLQVNFDNYTGKHMGE